MKKLLLGLSTILAATMALVAVAVQPINVSSTAFDNHGTVPLKNTAYGDNLSLQIEWSELPEGTEQLALIMDDPTASTPDPFVHWVVYNIPPSADGLPEGMTTDARVTDIAELAGTINGVNGTGRTGYFGPRPPAGSGDHAYHIWVYALDTGLDLPEGLDKAALQEAMQDHIIGAGMLMGHYEQSEE